MPPPPAVQRLLDAIARALAADDAMAIASKTSSDSPVPVGGTETQESGRGSVGTGDIKDRQGGRDVS